MSLVSQAEFARRSKVSKQYINKLIKNGILPIESSGKIDLEKCEVIFKNHRDQNDRNNQEFVKKQKAKGAVKAAEENARENPEPANFSWGSQYQKARAAAQSVKAQRENIELQRLQGSLIPVDNVKRQIELIANTVRTRLNKLPSKYAGRLEGLTVIEIEETLQTAIYEILSEFQDMLKDAKAKTKK